jgi:hypothetical protein
MEQNQQPEKTSYTQDQTEHFSPFKSYLNGIFFTMGALTVIVVFGLVFFLITLFFFGSIYFKLFA